MTGLPTRKYW